MPQSSLLSCCPSGLCSAAISTLYTQLEALANLALLPALRMDLAAATRFYVSFLEDSVVLSGDQALRIGSEEIVAGGKEIMKKLAAKAGLQGGYRCSNVVRGRWLPGSALPCKGLRSGPSRWRGPRDLAVEPQDPRPRP